MAFRWWADRDRLFFIFSHDKLTVDVSIFTPWKIIHVQTCADPVNVVRGGPALTGFLVDEGRDDSNTTISRPSSARRRLNTGLIVFFSGDLDMNG